MEWSVAKTGFAMFDALHAYGVALLLATVSGMSVMVRDDGVVYHLRVPWRFFLRPSPAVLDALFPLPSVEDMLALASGQESISLSVATLDGVLAALFTTRARIVSVGDVLRKVPFDPEIVQKSLSKATHATTQWKEYVRQHSSNNTDWLAQVLRDYTQASLTPPLPREGKRSKTSLTVVLTLDPALGFSLRQPGSNGQLHKKTGVVFERTHAAAFCAYLGASRFLRAQRVAGGLVNFFIPLASQLTIDVSTALMPLPPRDSTPQSAAIAHVLSCIRSRNMFVRSTQETKSRRCEAYPAFLWESLHPTQESTWKYLTYQTLSTQGLQQSISVSHAALECAWLTEIVQQKGEDMLSFWQSWLSPQSRKTHEEQERLVDCLYHRRTEDWHLHFCDVARRAYIQEDALVRHYRVEEVRMLMTTPAPLHTILERKEGTLRVGRALRQLGRYNPSLLREVLEGLETVQTLEQFLPVLHHAMQACVLAKANYPYIRIPTNRDIAVVLTDLELYGASKVASVLMILSSLRYARDEVDAYEVHTLIAVLLALLTQLPLVEDASSQSSEGDVSPHLDIISFALDEGEDAL